VFKACSELGGYSPASHRGAMSSIPGHSVRDLWWRKWKWDKGLSE